MRSTLILLLLVGAALCISIYDSMEEDGGNDSMEDDGGDGAALCTGQREPSFPISSQSFRQIQRMKTPVPEGRSTSLSDVMVRRYSSNSSVPKSYRIRHAQELLSDPEFDPTVPTVLYAHGYVELWTDDSVTTVMRAYLRRGGYNALLLDWSNLAFGSYPAVALDIQSIGMEVSRALSRLLEGGMMLDGLHLVGHSLGAHLLAAAARAMAASGVHVPRLTGLDPAYPGFYPPLLGAPMTATDSTFVDVIHTDGGSYGTPSATGQADFWPNEGNVKQPGCPSGSLPLTTEDLCSHWRSWAYWAESVEGGLFLARPCDSYDEFLRGACRDDPVNMGIAASPKLKGNFYLRTAANSPYALGKRGAE